MKRLLIAAVCVLATSAFAQRDFSKVEMKATKVNGSVYMLEGAGGNIGVSVGNDGAVMIDDQFLPLAGKIEAAVKQITDKPLRYVLNTHWHGDHTGSNEHFGPKAAIVAHDNVRKRLAGGASTRFGKVEPTPAAGLPVITFDHTLTIHLNGEEVVAIHVPNAHTDGDTVVWFTKSNVVHMGDLLFAGRFPFVDLDSGGSVQGTIKGVEHVLNHLPDDATFIPGHGPLVKKDGVRTYLAALRESLEGVEKAMKAGMTVEQMKGARKQVLGKYAESEWGSGFIKDDVWIDILYASLKGAPKGKNPAHPHGHAPSK